MNDKTPRTDAQVIAEGNVAGGVVPAEFARQLEVERNSYAAAAEKAVMKNVAPSAERATVTDEMVDRFLSWSLPEDFAPDCGISFSPPKTPHPIGYWPIGTNLLTAYQARQMLEHVVGPLLQWDIRSWWKSVQEAGVPISHEDGWTLSATPSSASAINSNPEGGERRGQSPAPVLPTESSAGAQSGVTGRRDAHFQKVLGAFENACASYWQNDMNPSARRSVHDHQGMLCCARHALRARTGPRRTRVAAGMGLRRAGRGRTPRQSGPTRRSEPQMKARLYFCAKCGAAKLRPSDDCINPHCAWFRARSEGRGASG
jgi:hypothetical protein